MEDPKSDQSKKEARLAYWKKYNTQTRDREKGRDYGREKYQRDIRPRRMLRKAALIQEAGGACQICGYNKNYAALEFDHLFEGDSFRAHGVRGPEGAKNPEKTAALSHLFAKNSYKAFLEAIAESKKCRLLCANCHREATYPEHDATLLDVPDLAVLLKQERQATEASKTRTPEQRARMKASQPRTHKNKKVAVESIDPRTGEVREYPSMLAAEKTTTGVDTWGITLALRGKLKTHAGLWWRKLPKPGEPESD